MAIIEKRVSSKGIISFRAKIRLRGFPPASATFARKTDAHRWAQRTEADMQDGKYFPNTKAKKNTVSDLIDAYLDHIKLTKPRRHDEVKPMLDWWKAEVGSLAVSYFTSQHVLEGQQKLLERKTGRAGSDGQPTSLSPARVNRYVVALHTAVHFGIRPLNWISENPVDGVDKLTEPGGRTRFLGPDEIDSLIAACRQSKNPHLLNIVIMGIATGARKSEIRFLRWQDVSPDGTLITLQKTKNGEVRSLQVTGIAAGIVNDLRQEKDEDAVFLFPSPDNPGRPIDFQSAWYRSLKIAKIEDFNFHDLRHTCGSYLAMNGASTIEIAEVLGHKTLQMARRYSHLTQTHTSSVVANMTGKVLGHVEI